MYFIYFFSFSEHFSNGTKVYEFNFFKDVKHPASRKKKLRILGTGYVTGKLKYTVRPRKMHYLDSYNPRQMNQFFFIVIDSVIADSKKIDSVG